ncbi:hypothetical protein [Gaoshiqia sp. Z1-71]|uniref:hypothetical protein n=1 Tax=Gaoshiqia hydrogeniformans TaxID=3290090 RepID=UPI003BF87E71
MIPNVFRNGCYAVRAATPEQLPDEGETGQTPLKPRPVESVAAANGVLEKVN